MLFYLFSSEELAELFARLGYPFEHDTIPRNVAYYSSRSTHGSTLSRVVSAWVLARSDRPRAMDFFVQALHSDVSDVQQGTTAEGVHLGAMAGSVDLVQRCFTGLELRDDELRFHPALPQELRRLSFRLRYRKHSLTVDVTPTELTLHSDPSGAEDITVVVDGQQVVLRQGGRANVRLSSSS
jgi:trehalose/maltose hydrolase-like predicted phosphorylase